MYQTDKCVVAPVLQVVVIINLIIIDHSRMIQAFRIIEISKYDDGGQLTTRGQLMQGSSTQKTSTCELCPSPMCLSLTIGDGTETRSRLSQTELG